MGIEKKDPANFSPSVEIPAKVNSFRFWCQKVLPLVYDDSLSYYELLCKVVNYLNNVIADVNTLGTDVDNLNNAYNKLQSYVNNYFSTLDVQEEINNKLDVMAQDGTLSSLIQPLFDEYKIDINNQVSQQNNKISVLESRMNTFTNLPSGSTTGDAELIDIRIGSDGYTYPTAGDAVRKQIDLLDLDLNEKIINTIGWNAKNILNVQTATVLHRDNTPSLTNDGFTLNATQQRANVINFVVPCKNNMYYTYYATLSNENATVGARFDKTLPSTFNSEVDSTTKLFYSEDNNYFNVGFVIPTNETLTVTNFKIYEIPYKAIQNQINEKISFIKPKWQNGKLYNLYTGLIQNNTAWACTEKINATIIPKIEYSIDFKYGASECFTLWKNNNYVGSYFPKANYGKGEYRDTQFKIVTTPIEFDTLSWMLQSCLNYESSLISIDSTLNNVINNLNPLYKNNVRIICIGDSLTQGDYGSEPAGTQNIHAENYPYFMAKYLELSLNDGVCNAGCSGFTPKAWYEAFTDSTSMFYDLWNGYFNTDKKIIVAIMLGTNGIMEADISTNTTTQSGCYSSIIERIYTLTNGKAEIILFGCPWVDKTKREGNYNNVTHNIPIIKTIAEKYHIPFINVFDKLGVNDFTTSVLQPIDGLHFGKDGYSRLGTFIGSSIKSVSSFIIE